MERPDEVLLRESASALLNKIKMEIIYVIANTTLEDVLDLIILSDNFFLNN